MKRSSCHRPNPGGVPLVGGLLLSVALHALVLAPPRPSPSPTGPVGAAAPLPRFRLMAVGAPGTSPPHQTPRPAEPRERPPPAPAAAPPAPSVRLQPPQITPAPRAAPTAADPGPGPQAAAVPLPPASAPPTGHWRFALELGNGEGVADLRWQHDGQRYTLTLERALADRPLPSWRSEGTLSPHGLQPTEFTVQRGRRRQESVRFSPDEGMAHFSALQGSQPVAAGTQDRLSWMLQLVALAQAAPPDSAELRLPLVGWRGGHQVLVFRREALEAADPPHWQRWRGEHAVADGFLVEAWLDPAQGHTLQRLRQTFEGEPRSQWRRLDVSE